MSDIKNVKQVEQKSNENDFNKFEALVIDSCKWVYVTPPAQKIKKPKLKGCCIQTAISYSKSKTEKEVFELKMDGFQTNEISYNFQYMEQIIFNKSDQDDVKECQSILEPSRQTKFVKRYQMEYFNQDVKKLKRNLFDHGTN